MKGGKTLLSEKKMKCAKLLLDGDMTISQIAKEVGVSYNTVGNWRDKDKDFRNYYKKLEQERRDNLIQIANEKLTGGCEQAIEGLIYLSQHAESESVRLQALTQILDRTLGKATTKTEVEVTNNTTNTVEPNDIANKIADMFGSGAPIFIEEHKIEEVDIDSNSDIDIDKDSDK